jgi:pimeloyl-ACP methyl ester carboxylesterase
MPHGAITTEYYAAQVIDFLAKNNLEKTHILGYSMGGYIGMYLAKHSPEKVMSLTTFATKWAWTSEVAEKEAAMLNPEKIEEKVPKFASNLATVHGETEWKILVNLIKDFLLHLGIVPTFSLSDFSNIEIPIKLGVGDRDLTVSIDETIAVYRQLSNAQLFVLPNTPHSFEKVNIDVLKRVML